MMSAQQLQYYSFLERQRKQALYNQSLTYQYITAIRRLIGAGGDPTLDPELSAAYYLLISEYGEQAIFFNFEDENGKCKYIQLENDEDVANN